LKSYGDLILIEPYMYVVISDMSCVKVPIT
jgi:hypothetical protein